MKPEPEQSPRRILLTQSTLFSIGGSEMITFELAEYFSGQGDAVLVVCYGIGGDWSSDFAALEGVSVLRFDDVGLDRAVEDFAPTVVWAHHQILPPFLMRRPSGVKFVFHHMSISHPMEFPIAHRIESKLAGAIVFTSPEALEHQVKTGLLQDVASNKLGVFGNPAPRYFEQSTRSDPALEAVLIVSNHAPEELSEALTDLAPTCTVTSLGSENEIDNRRRRIVPSDLEGVDAIVSIGKTVQLAVIAGVPVYCYDHFGGPGWLTESNFELARFHNFSGRGFDRKSATEIRAEIVGGYPAAAGFADKARVDHADRFRLDLVVEDLLASTDSYDGARPEERDIVAHELEMQLRSGVMNAIAARDQTIEFQRGQLELAEARSHVVSEPSHVVSEPPKKQSIFSRWRFTR